MVIDQDEDHLEDLKGLLILTVVAFAKDHSVKGTIEHNVDLVVVVVVVAVC